MADVKSQEGWQEATNGAAANAEDGWAEVAAESQIVFDTIGDVFTGQFLGMEKLSSGIPQAHFKNAEGEFFTNCGRDLEQKLRKVPNGRQTRIEYVDNLDTGQATPMHVFKVQWR